MKKEQGITLISLVVTIIVLIILAGISINLILGQDGIINKAKQAKENMEYAQIEEQAQLNELYDQMSQESGGSISYDAIAKLSEFKTKVSEAITEKGVETSKDASADTMANNIKKINNNFLPEGWLYYKGMTVTWDDWTKIDVSKFKSVDILFYSGVGTEKMDIYANGDITHLGTNVYGTTVTYDVSEYDELWLKQVHGIGVVNCTTTITSSELL